MVADDQPGLAAAGDDASSSRATRRPEIEVSGIAARHSFVTSSMTFRMRKRRPEPNWSWDKVERPPCVRPRLDQKRRPRARGPFAAAPATDDRPSSRIVTLGLLPVQDMAFTAQQNVQPPIAETALAASWTLLSTSRRVWCCWVRRGFHP